MEGGLGEPGVNRRGRDTRGGRARASKERGGETTDEEKGGRSKFIVVPCYNLKNLAIIGVLS